MLFLFFTAASRYMIAEATIFLINKSVADVETRKVFSIIFLVIR